jgi:hypothetical protein
MPGGSVSVQALLWQSIDQVPGTVKGTLPRMGISTLRSPVQLAVVGDSSLKVALPWNGAGGSTVASVGAPVGPITVRPLETRAAEAVAKVESPWRDFEKSATKSNRGAAFVPNGPPASSVLALNESSPPSNLRPG